MIRLRIFLNKLDKRVCIFTYNAYLKENGLLRNRGFKLIQGFEKVTQSDYFKPIYKLSYKLIGEGITEKDDINEFMVKARKLLGRDFNPVTCVESFDEILEIEVEYFNISQIYSKIQSSVEYLKKIKLNNDIKISEMLKGKPPLIVKFWKNGDVDVYTLVVLLDIPTLKKQKWFNIYCGNRMVDITVAGREIRDNQEIKTIVKKMLTK